MQGAVPKKLAEREARHDVSVLDQTGRIPVGSINFYSPSHVTRGIVGERCPRSQKSFLLSSFFSCPRLRGARQKIRTKPTLLSMASKARHQKTTVLPLHHRIAVPFRCRTRLRLPRTKKTILKVSRQRVCSGSFQILRR